MTPTCRSVRCGLPAVSAILLLMAGGSASARPVEAQQPTPDLTRTSAGDDVVSRARRAGRVVVATVIDVAPIAASNEFGDLLIVSRTTLAVEEVLRGELTSTVMVDVEGGSLGGLTLEVSDMPSLEPGDRGVFLLDPSIEGVSVLHDRGRGFLRLTDVGVVESDQGGLSGLTLDSIRRDLSVSGPIPQ